MFFISLFRIALWLNLVKKSKDPKKNKSKDFLKKSEKFEHINRTYDEHKKRNILEIHFK